MATFSQRQGLVEIPDAAQLGWMSEALQNSLWNVLHDYYFSGSFVYSRVGDPPIMAFSRALWDEHFKKPVDSRPSSGSQIVEQIRSYFFACSWHQVYDLLEWISANRDSAGFDRALNAVLARELGGYRLVAHVFVDVTTPEELREVQLAVSDETLDVGLERLRLALG